MTRGVRLDPNERAPLEALLHQSRNEVSDDLVMDMDVHEECWGRVGVEEDEVVEHVKDLLLRGGIGVPIEADFVRIEAKWGIPDDEICTR